MHALRYRVLSRTALLAGVAFLLLLPPASWAQKADGSRSDTVKIGGVMLPSAFLDQTVRAVKAEGGALVFADEKGKLVIAERAGERFKIDFWMQETFVLAARRVIDRGTPLIIEGGSDQVPGGLKPIPDVLQSYLAFPLKQGPKVFGVLNLVRMYGQDNFSQEDLDLVELLVRQSADVVEQLKAQSIKDLVQKREMAATSKVYFAPDESVIREKSASLEIGLNLLLAAMPLFYSDTIDHQGMNIGLLVPIRVPNALIWYRVKALFHGTRSYRGRQNYVTGVNEIVCGKSLKIKGIPFEYTPLLGVGFNNGIVLQNMFAAGFSGAGVHYFWQYDIGLMIREQYRLKTTPLAQGILINFERAFVYDDNPKMRCNLSLIMSY